MNGFKRRSSALLGVSLWLLASVGAQAQSQVQTQAPVQAPPPAAPPAPPNPYAVTLNADQIDLLARTLREAGSHGLEAEAYAPEPALALLGGRDEAGRQAGQRQLIVQVLTYAKAVRSGRLPLSAFDANWGLRPAAFDPSAGFVQAVAEDRLSAWLDALPPPYTGYQNLRGVLITYRDIRATGGWTRLPVGADLKLGSTDNRVVALEARLAIEDPGVVVDGAALFDEALVQGLMRAQKRLGLNPSGVLDKATAAALNVPVEKRIDQIIANLERWRWLPQTLPVDRIQVNIAAAVLAVFHEDAPTLTMRAVTGRPGDETPMLTSQIHSIVLNPPWNVPSSIATKEVWPKARLDPGYLARNDFIVIPLEGGGSRLQQKAGPKSALGQVKFDFNNPYGVYLHDTPSRARFASPSRLASHGCVRVEKPIELAKLLTAGDPTWTPETIEATIAAGKTVRASLSKPMAVFLLYWTAYVTPEGQVGFRDDPYGWDRLLLQRIAAGSVN